MEPAAVERQLEDTLRPVVENLGLELVSVEFAAEPAGPVLRVVLDRPGGINLEDLTLASRALDPVLDRSTPIKRSFRLEVSSPGVERPLRKREDFERFAGERAHVRTAEKIAGRRNFTGTIEGVEPKIVRLRVEDQILDIPLDAVTKAHLVVDL